MPGSAGEGRQIEALPLGAPREGMAYCCVCVPITERQASSAHSLTRPGTDNHDITHLPFVHPHPNPHLRLHLQLVIFTDVYALIADLRGKLWFGYSVMTLQPEAAAQML